MSKRALFIVSCLSTVLLLGGLVAFLALRTPDPSVVRALTQSAQQQSAPKPITRSQLMTQYAEIDPIDNSATPETVDTVATNTCALLKSGRSTDQLISDSTQYWGPKSTQVIKLLVSYKCPQFLADFN